MEQSTTAQPRGVDNDVMPSAAVPAHWTAAGEPKPGNPLLEEKPAEEEDFLAGVKACSIVDPTCEACQ